MALTLVSNYNARELLNVYEGADYAELFEELNGYAPKWIPYSKPASAEYLELFRIRTGVKVKPPSTVVTDSDGTQRRVRLWMRNY